MISTFPAELDRLMAEFISTVFALLRSTTLEQLAAATRGPTLPSNADRRPGTSALLRRESRPLVDRATPRRRGLKRVPITHAEQRALRLQRAREWQRQLDAGEISSRAGIARREGLSRARVTQLLNLLRKRR